MRFATNMVVITAVSLSFAPVVAEAGTKASAAIAPPPTFGTRISAPVEKKNKAMPREAWLAALAAIAAGYGAYHVIDNKETSRGS
jgi:hypothetical protein